MLLCVLVAGFASYSFRSRGAGAQNATAKGSPTRQPATLAGDPSNISNEQRAGKIKAMAAYWDGHKEQMRRLMKVDYPATVACRDARDSNYEVVATSVKTQKAAFEKAVLDQDRFRQDIPLQRVLDSPLVGFWASQVMTRDLSDTTAVTDDLTVADLIHQMMANPDEVKEFQAANAGVERDVFHDEDAAQKVEAIQASEELIVYASESEVRYQSAMDKAMDDVVEGKGRVREMLTQAGNAMAIAGPAELYLKSHNTEAANLLAEYD